MKFVSSQKIWELLILFHLIKNHSIFLWFSKIWEPSGKTKNNLFLSFYWWLVLKLREYTFREKRGRSTIKNFQHYYSNSIWNINTSVKNWWCKRILWLILQSLSIQSWNSSSNGMVKVKNCHVELVKINDAHYIHMSLIKFWRKLY